MDLALVSTNYTVYGIFANGTNATVGTGAYVSYSGRAVYNFTAPLCLSLYQAFVVNATAAAPAPTQ